MKQGNWIFLVEDEYLEVEDLTEAVKEEFPHLEVKAVTTECEFRSSYDSLAKNPPAAVIIDIMLPWENAVPDEERTPPPPEVEEEGAMRAGFRCRQLISDNEETRRIPVILFSHLSEKFLKEQLGSLPEPVTFLGKNSDYSHLKAQLRGMLR